jgi:hypothetical protein
VLTLEVVDEGDPIFHHSVTLSEGEFAELKAEQAILVDFAAFPRQVTELLDKCREGDAQTR